MQMQLRVKCFIGLLNRTETVRIKASPICVKIEAFILHVRISRLFEVLFVRRDQFRIV